MTESSSWISTTDGVQLHYSSWGADGHRTPILFLHGLISHSQWFSPVANYLADRDTPVFALDRRGSGHSQAIRGDCQDYRQWLLDVEAMDTELQRRHPNRPIHIYGHCFGALPTLLFAHKHPERISSLILGTPGIATQIRFPIYQIMLFPFFLLFRPKSYFPVPLKPEMFTEIPAYIEKIRQDPMVIKNATARLFLQVLRLRRWNHQRINEITSPVFLVSAGRDDICDNRRIKHFYSHVSSTVKAWIEYPQAKHMIEYSNHKDQYFADLFWWLSRLEGVKPDRG